MSVKAAEIDQMWEKLGFTVVHSKADVTAILWIDQRQYLRTRRSHGSGKLNGQIPMFIRQQMKLNEQQFADALQCPLTRQAFLAILCRKQIVPADVCRTLGIDLRAHDAGAESSQETDETGGAAD